jgi:uncharacterized SAM-binding protein YcdF (DUF218 family)
MYKLITILLEPYTLLLLSLLGWLLWAWNQNRPRRQVLAVAVGLVGLLCLLSLPAVGHLAEGSLEWSYPPVSEVPARADTIVVLSANAQVVNPAGTKLRIGDETLVRCLHAFQLYDQAGGCRVIVSGGKLDPSRPGMAVAEAMRDFLVTLGVRPVDLILEDKSTTTFENARNTTELLRGEPLLHAEKKVLQDPSGPRVFLVTTASHMRRAQRCFARQGTEVIPAPCNHQAVRLELSPASFVPSVSGIHRVQRALHEWLGLAWYWLCRRI